MRFTNCIVLTLVLIAALSFGTAAQTVTLRHFVDGSHGVPFRQYIEQKAQEYEALNPHVTIEIELGPSSRAYMEQAIIREASDVAPDIYTFNENWGGKVIGGGSDMFLDLRPYFEKEPELLQELIPLAMNGFTWIDGSIWAFPIDVYPNMTLYNKTMLTEMGLTAPIELGNNWTWDVFYEYARLLSRDIDGDGENDRWATTQVPRQWTQGTAVGQAGGSIVNSRVNPTQVQLLTPEVITAAEHLVSIVRNGHMGPSNGFQRGEVAMRLTQGPSHLWNEREKGTLSEFEWGIARPLHGPDNNGTLVALIGFQISKATKHPDEAWDWVRFLAGSVDAQLEYAALSGRVPTLRQAIQEYAAITDMPPYTEMEIFYTVSNPNSFHNIVGGVIDIQTEAGEFNTRALDNTENPVIVLQEMQQRIEGMLNQALGQ